MHQYDAGYLWNLLHLNNLCRCRCTCSRSYEVTISYTVSFRKHFDDIWQTPTCTCQRNTIEIDEREKKPRRFLRWQIDLFQQRNSQGQNQFLRRFIMGNLVTFFIKKSLSTHRPIFNIIVRVLFCCFSSFQISLPVPTSPLTICFRRLWFFCNANCNFPRANLINGKVAWTYMYVCIHHNILFIRLYFV